MQSYKVSTAPVSVMHPQTLGNSDGTAGLILLTEVQNWVQNGTPMFSLYWLDGMPMSHTM